MALVAPLWVFYELVAYLINQGFDGQLRTGIDLFVKHLFTLWNVPLELFLVSILSGLIIYLISHSKELIDLKAMFLIFILLESLVYSAILGLVGGRFARVFLVQGEPDAGARGFLATFIINIGAGVYEEMVFRLILVSLFIWIMTKAVGMNRSLGAFFSIVISSVLFSLGHYLSFFNESFELSSFLFRFAAGMVFGFLFLIRGFGISVYTHAFYNVLMMIRQT
jgi:membrane protease YdiL (CAAX protease family)